MLLENLWPRAVEDAGLDPGQVQLVVVALQEQGLGSAEAAYAGPSYYCPDNDLIGPAVLRAAPSGLLHTECHTIVVWPELPGCDEAAILGLLRHELEHAQQWESLGPPFIDHLNAELLSLVAEPAEQDGYHSVPSERAADVAARLIVRRVYGDSITMGPGGRFEHWATAIAPQDLWGETVAAIRQRADRREFFGELHDLDNFLAGLQPQRQQAGLRDGPAIRLVEP